MTHGHTDIQLPPLDKRYGPIISSICGPNNNRNFVWYDKVQACFIRIGPNADKANPLPLHQAKKRRGDGFENFKKYLKTRGNRRF